MVLLRSAEQYQKGTFFLLVMKGELTNYGITRTTDVTQSVPRHVWSDMVAPDIAKATHSSNAICFYFFQYHFNLFSGMFFEGDEGSRFQDIVLHTSHFFGCCCTTQHQP